MKDVWGVHWGVSCAFFGGTGIGQHPVSRLPFCFGWKHSFKAFLVLENQTLSVALV